MCLRPCLWRHEGLAAAAAAPSEGALSPSEGALALALPSTVDDFRLFGGGGDGGGALLVSFVALAAPAAAPAVWLAAVGDCGDGGGAVSVRDAAPLWLGAGRVTSPASEPRNAWAPFTLDDEIDGVAHFVYGDWLMLFLSPAQCNHGVTQWAAGVKMQSAEGGNIGAVIVHFVCGDLLVLFLTARQCKHGVTQWAADVKLCDGQVLLGPARRAALRDAGGDACGGRGRWRRGDAGGGALRARVHAAAG